MTSREEVDRILAMQAQVYAREEAARVPPKVCDGCGVIGHDLDLDEDGYCLLCLEQADAWG